MIKARPASVTRWLKKARQLEQITLALRLSTVAALYFTLGHVHALTAVWLHSLWALLPPLTLLAAFWVERWPPTPRFPLGFYRTNSIAFLVTSLALATMGLYLVAAALHALVASKPPELATFWEASTLAQWPGWPMLAALTYTAAIPFLLGHPRMRLARTLNDKGLYADSAIGQANLLAATAAATGIVGLGFGLGWADPVAELLIGAGIACRGGRHTYTATRDLMDELPRRPGSHRIDPVLGQIQRYLESLDWVERADVALREHGRMLVGRAIVSVRAETAALEHLRLARAQVLTLDWRLLDFHIVPQAVADTRWVGPCNR